MYSLLNPVTTIEAVAPLVLPLVVNDPQQMGVAASKLSHSGMGVGQLMPHFLFVCCYVFLGIGIDWSFLILTGQK